MNNTFLNGDLTKTDYMEQLSCFEDSTKSFYVCKLNKALCGQEQAPRAWFTKLKSTLLSWGFYSSILDTSLLVKKTKDVILYIC